MAAETVQIQISRIVKESARAVQVEIEVANRCGDSRPWTLWLPKSQIQIEASTVSLPEWLASEKMNEVFSKTNSLIVVSYSNGDIMM